MRGWCRWALVSPNEVAPSRMINLSASVNLPLHREVQKFSSGTGSPGWSRKKGRKTVVVCCFNSSHLTPWFRLTFNIKNYLCIMIKTPLPSVLWRCWLGGRKGIWPVKNWVVRYWHGYLSAAMCKWFAYGPADATATPCSLASLKCRLVLLFDTGIPRLSWKIGFKWVSCLSMCLSSAGSD